VLRDYERCGDLLQGVSRDRPALVCGLPRGHTPSHRDLRSDWSWEDAPLDEEFEDFDRRIHAT
jgi:hypothetical protein